MRLLHQELKTGARNGFIHLQFDAIYWSGCGPPIMALMMEYTENSIFYPLSGLSIMAAIATFFAIKPNKEESK